MIRLRGGLRGKERPLRDCLASAVKIRCCCPGTGALAMDGGRTRRSAAVWVSRKEMGRGRRKNGAARASVRARVQGRKVNGMGIFGLG